MNEEEEAIIMFGSGRLILMCGGKQCIVYAGETEHKEECNQ